ncbi:MAG: major capsid protein [Gemmatimonadota bacterium]
MNVPLTNISIAFIQNTANFVADRVFPNIPVQKQSDRYYTYDRGDFNRDEMAIRAPGTESAGGGYKIDNTPTYFAPVYAFHKDIDDQVRANADSVLAPDREATVYVTHKALIRREKLWVSKFFQGGIWTNDWDGIAGSPTTNQVWQWSDYTNSDPITDVRRAKRTILESTGFEPNKLVLGRPVYDALVDHPDVIDRVKYGQTQGGPATANRETLARLFEVDEVVVMNAIENTANEGAANRHAFIGGRRALLCYAPPSPGLMVPSAGYTFSWTGFLGAGAAGNRIKQFRMEHLSADRIEIEMAFDQRLISADLGFFWDTIVAP